ncbi:leucyl aminopeptidase [Agrococcus sediminis]|uniref:Probable cytosol aminopeptidase n=1 Tax=Agrococcus sediminis TaxID=2599924 RepID=A0A5M8QFV5_9MICO|nr:leucyl aminopeptidase [Agrococcus sediminis]KAA6433820.1 leucyl aminopeptidase [Agrococcus sediminis]RWR18409.1 leucyl aminopeptidase [Agrococcus lahaulensis]
MPIPALSIIARPEDATAELTVHGVTAGDEPAAQGFDPELLSGLGITGKREQVTRAVVDGRAVAFVGLGDDLSSARLREVAGAAVRALRDVPSLALALPVTTTDDVLAVLEGAALGAYRYTGLKRDQRPGVLEIAVVAGEAEVTETVVAMAQAASQAVWTTRDLANTPPNLLSPVEFADRVVAEGEAAGLSVVVRDEERLRREGFGGILAVGQGSSRPPRLVTIEHAPENATRHVVLVGKGITFDSGGLSLKPAASMQHMKYDMTGAATVHAVVVAAAALQLPIRITAHLCLAENLVSSTSTRPDDVITMRGGTTVEVTNTDAEGRLVMADGLVLASEAMPDAIIDVATLTGAQQIALGNRVSGVMGNDDAFVDAVVRAGREVGEQLWPMPIPEEMLPMLDSEVADLANAKVGNRAGGMLLAAAFLAEFIGERDGARIPWAHLDIAGPSTNTGSAFGFTPVGATGVTVRGLLRMLSKMSRSAE